MRKPRDEVPAEKAPYRGTVLKDGELQVWTYGEKAVFYVTATTEDGVYQSPAVAHSREEVRSLAESLLSWYEATR